MKLETLLVHGHKSASFEEKDVAPALHLSTTFERERDGTYPEGYSYTRRENPNRSQLEAALAALEGGAGAACFASGSAATSALFQALKSGDHVIAPNDAYYGTGVIIRDFARWGLTADFIDMADLTAVERAVKPGKTALVWVETPSNPQMRVTDLAVVAKIAHKAGALVVADNTVATPILCRPFAFDVDFAMHSTTKYVSGHSDVLGGAVVAREASATWEKIRAAQHFGGAVASPFDCWLALRGLRTMALRVREQSRSALALAQFLATHRHVERVYYAGLPEHRGHALAAKQMTAFGGLLSFTVKAGKEAAFKVAGAVRLLTRATSLGGIETLIEHRASMEGPGTSTPENLLRVSVGLEHVDDLIQDLGQALASLD